jgi:membrane-bound metal-dependent hydrolase YbcI (DUF457 family)
MPEFKTHSAIGLAVGATYGAVGYYYGMPLNGCLLSVGLFTGASLLSDVDTNSVPLREISSFLGATASILTVLLLQPYKYPNETLLVCAISAYVAIRFLIVSLVLRFAVHRGSMHSIIMAVLLAEIGMLAFSGLYSERFYKAGALFLGFILHLILDEIWGFRKESFGTAFKLFGHGWIINTVLTVVVVALAVAIKMLP